MSRMITSFFYVGLLRPAPGTWGSAAAMLAGWVLHQLGGPVLLACATVVVCGVGYFAIRAETRGLDDPDKSEIVVDEVVGQWIALLPVSYGAFYVDTGLANLWPGLVAAFVLFRLFDIWKPGPIGKADRRGDVLGVLLDDVIAGIFAALSGIILAVVAHLVFL